MLLAFPDLAAGNVMTILIGRGAPGWFHLLVLCIWNAFKFLVMGPVSVVLLVRTRIVECRNRRMPLRSPAPDNLTTSRHPRAVLAHRARTSTNVPLARVQALCVEWSIGDSNP